MHQIKAYHKFQVCISYFDIGYGLAEKLYKQHLKLTQLEQTQDSSCGSRAHGSISKTNISGNRHEPTTTIYRILGLCGLSTGRFNNMGEKLIH